MRGWPPLLPDAAHRPRRAACRVFATSGREHMGERTRWRRARHWGAEVSRTSSSALALNGRARAAARWASASRVAALSRMCLATSAGVRTLASLPCSSQLQRDLAEASRAVARATGAGNVSRLRYAASSVDSSQRCVQRHGAWTTSGGAVRGACSVQGPIGRCFSVVS